MNYEESKRIHLDWWGKCRTCRWWAGPRSEMRLGELAEEED